MKGCQYVLNSMMIKMSWQRIGIASVSRRSLTQQVRVNELKIPMPWGYVSGQTFGDIIDKKTNKQNKPIVALHGFLDNSNSFKPLASELCPHGFYIIALDLPGHGFSSHLPNGMSYSPKMFLMSVRRAIRYLELKKFIFLTHSFGTLVSFMYETIFKDEVEALLANDFIFNLKRRKQEDFHKYWKKSIDAVIDYEQKQLAKSNEDAQPKRLLTHEIALKLLMDANNHLDETSAKLLLERGLVVNQNGLLKFSRDIRVKVDFANPDIFLELHQLYPNVQTNLSAPILFTIAWPPAYGDENYEETLETLKKINSINKFTKFEHVQVAGTHHFHMIKPTLTSKIILRFLRDKGLLKNETN